MDTVGNPVLCGGVPYTDDGGDNHAYNVYVTSKKYFSKEDKKLRNERKMKDINTIKFDFPWLSYKERKKELMQTQKKQFEWTYTRIGPESLGLK